MKRIFAVLLIAAVFAFAAKAVYKPTPIGREFQILRHNINQVECCVSNYGKFGQDETGNNAGCWWPVGSNQNYIYGAGSWFGTVDVNGDSLVTIGYGPHGGESEYAPGRMGWSVSDPRAIIYMMPSTWPPPVDPELPMAPTEAKSHQDSWCVYNDGDIQYHIAGDTRPIELEVYQTVYAWNLSTTADIIFIRYECVNTTEDTLKQCYFGVCADNDIGNEAGNAANDRISGIVGQWYVIEGDSTWIDNLGYQWQEVEEPGTPPWMPGTIGFDYLQSPWDIVPDEDKDGDGILDQYEMDSVYFYENLLGDSLFDADLDGTPDFRDPSQIPQLGMTAFKRFTLNLEPNLDYERYTTLAGYNFRTGVYEPYDTVPPDPDDQRFLQCSGPFDLPPHESATVLVGIVFAHWIGIYGRPDTALVEVDATAQFIFDQNWLLPGPPPSPAITLLPGDARVTLVWDNAAEVYADPYFGVVGTDPSSPLYDPFYAEYDFEGYRVWKSTTGQTGDWELLATYDLANDIEFTDTAFMPAPLELENAGISHIFVDEDVRNGFVYYYAVTAFDYNRVKEAYSYDSIFPIESLPYVYIDTLTGIPDTFYVYTVYDTITVDVTSGRPVWFESGLSGDSVRARRDPANYIPPSDPMVTLVSGNDSLTALVDASVAFPQDIDPNYPLYIEFAPPEPVVLYFIDGADTIPYTGARYTAHLQDDNGTLETFVYDRRIGTPYVPLEIVPPVNGMFINPDIGTPALPAVFPVFDSIIIESGSYPANLLVAGIGSPLPYAETVADSTDMHGMWAWRGNSYQVVWSRKTPGSPVNTVTVTDLVTGEDIPYRQYQNTPSTVDLADGWCFTWHTPSSAWSKASHDTVQVGSAFSPAERTRHLYVNGGMIALRSNSYMIDTILPEDGETWVLRANQEYLPPSVYGKIEITATPGVFTDTAMTLNVKVVPNPYVISNEWQTRFVQRRVKFINLPNQCTIRIFNLNGELVRTLLHQETSEGGVGNNLGGDEWWDVLSENRQLVASGVYIFHIDSDVGEQVGKFVIVR
ncbi:MAG: T9SS type A sorting domain-containing protein [candidate division WOR-3 bacterium]|nr:MAG: T9SS type A sorting domain-containing protein [candidate division WOR-3 bacterium]